MSPLGYSHSLSVGHVSSLAYCRPFSLALPSTREAHDVTRGGEAKVAGHSRLATPGSSVYIRCSLLSHLPRRLHKLPGLLPTSPSHHRLVVLFRLFPCPQSFVRWMIASLSLRRSLACFLPRPSSVSRTVISPVSFLWYHPWVGACCLLVSTRSPRTRAVIDLTARRRREPRWTSLQCLSACPHAYISPPSSTCHWIFSYDLRGTRSSLWYLARSYWYFPTAWF